MTRVTGLQIVIVTLTALGARGALGRAAYADNGMVVTTGNATERERAIVAEVFANAAVNAGWSLSSKRLTPKEGDALANCKAIPPIKCVPATLGASNIDRLLVVTVNATQADGVPTLELVGRVILTKLEKTTDDKRYCEKCSEDQLRTTSAELADTVLRRLATQSAQTFVEITSDPPGAQIVLDNGSEPIGVSPGTFQTYPGKHIVILQKPGFTSAQQEFEVKEGETAHLTFPLHQTDTGPVTTQPAPPSRVPPGIVIGAGATAIVAAGILYAYDEDDGPKVGDTYTDTAPGAVALGIGGVITVGVGYYWWRKRSHARSAPNASLIPGGAVFGWSGTF